MNSVILHFRHSTDEVVVAAAQCGIINGTCKSASDDSFLFWEYEEYETENGEDEKRIVESMLGCEPVSSFQLLCRTTYAHFALQKVIELFSLTKGIMDDDNDGYWGLNDLESAYGAGKESTIYNVSEFKS